MSRANLILIFSALLTACGGGTTSPTATVPGAPTLTTVTAGDTQATLNFTAPSSNGGATVTSYTATCTASGSSRTATGSGSPITVAGLINGTTYSCSVTATNAVGTGSASSSTNVTPAAASAGAGTSTAAVACNYSTNVFNSSASVNAQSTSSWSCSSTNRNLTSNGIPDHSVGTFPNQGNPNTISVQSISVSYPIVPAQTGSVNSTLISLGHALNGIKFEPGTGGTCNDSGSNCTLNGSVGSWRIEAIGQTSFNFGVDFNNAHVQPTGEYHYHGMPERFIEKLGKGEQMTLVGWAADGFPVYAKYGYSTANSASSAIKILASSYRLKSTPTAGRPATTLYPMGTFTQDYEYVAGSGDLDECNGRTGVTPEFPNGIYYYVITTGYPYIQRCVKGSATAGGPPPR
jgi:hypothetical protein